MENPRSHAIEIVDIFSSFLEDRDIDVPCEDEDEDDLRYEGDNYSPIFGTERQMLVDELERYIRAKM